MERDIIRPQCPSRNITTAQRRPSAHHRTIGQNHTKTARTMHSRNSAREARTPHMTRGRNRGRGKPRGPPYNPSWTHPTPPYAPCPINPTPYWSSQPQGHTPLAQVVYLIDAQPHAGSLKHSVPPRAILNTYQMRSTPSTQTSRTATTE